MFIIRISIKIIMEDDKNKKNDFNRDDLNVLLGEHKDMANFDLFKDLVTSVYNLAEKNKINPEDSKDVIEKKKQNDSLVKLNLKLMQLNAMIENPNDAANE